MVNCREMPAMRGVRLTELFSGKRRKDRAFPIERILTVRQRVEACIDEQRCDSFESTLRCAKKCIAIMRLAKTYAELDACAALLSARLGIAKEIILDEATGRMRYLAG